MSNYGWHEFHLFNIFSRLKGKTIRSKLASLYELSVRWSNQPSKNCPQSQSICPVSSSWWSPCTWIYWQNQEVIKSTKTSPYLRMRLRWQNKLFVNTSRPLWRLSMKSTIRNKKFYEIKKEVTHKANLIDCLVFEVLCTKKLKPNLNVQTDSILAKLFV